jgi:hypothetical protein
MLWPKDSEDYYIVVHSQEERDQYVKNRTIDPLKVIVSSMPHSMGATRNWIHRNMVSEGEFYLSLDDNIKSITAFPGPFYDEQELPDDTLKSERKNLLSGISWAQFNKLLWQTLTEAARKRANLIGFAPISNPYFRGRKFRDVGFVIGQMFVAKKTAANFDPSFVFKEDYDFTAQNLLKHGRVLINNYIWPEKKHYEKGGCGSLKERTRQLVLDSEKLFRKYPGLFRYNSSREGFDEKAEVLIRFTQSGQIDKWRIATKHMIAKEAYGEAELH